MKKRLKLILRWLCLILALALVVLGLGFWHKFGTFIVAARSIRQLQDGLYVMEYRGDYGLDEFLAQGGADSDSAVADYLIGFLSGGFYRKAVVRQHHRIQGHEFKQTLGDSRGQRSLAGYSPCVAKSQT